MGCNKNSKNQFGTKYTLWFMFGRGNDTTNIPKNLCAMYYVSPTSDISKGEIRMGLNLKPLQALPTELHLIQILK